MKRYTPITAIFLLAALLFGCIGTKGFPIKGIGLSKCEVSKSYTENTPYQEMEYYIWPIPYKIQEPYIDNECIPVAYNATECIQQNLNFSTTYTRCISRMAQCIPTQLVAVSTCNITNFDSADGNFTVYIGFSTSTSEEGENLTLRVASQKTRAFTYRNDIACTETGQGYNLDLKPPEVACFCIVQSVPTKEVCADVVKTKDECHNVTKYRTVIEYRNETRSRNITKYRIENRSEIVEEVC